MLLTAGLLSLLSLPVKSAALELVVDAVDDAAAD